MYKPKREFMELAISEANKAIKRGDYGIGSAIVKHYKIVVSSGDLVKSQKNPILHAEVIAIQNATNKLNSKFLKDCILYTTHEPCPMCAAAAVWARMKGIVFGSTWKDMKDYGQKYGNRNYTWRTINIPASSILRKGEPKLFVIGSFMRDECKRLFHN